VRECTGTGEERGEGIGHGKKDVRLSRKTGGQSNSTATKAASQCRKRKIAAYETVKGGKLN